MRVYLESDFSIGVTPRNNYYVIIKSRVTIGECRTSEVLIKPVTAHFLATNHRANVQEAR